MSVKKHIVDTMKRLYNNKYISIRDGNVSFKPKNENYFYISAGSVRKNEINEDQIIKVDFKKKTEIYKGSKIDHIYDLRYDKDLNYKPSREINMHSYLQTYYKNFNKDTFVIHAHPPNIISFIGTNNKNNQLNNVKKIFPEINVGDIGKNVKYYDAGSIELAKNCFTSLVDNEIVGLERHGSLSIGSDIDRVFENIETLEYYLDIILKSKK